MSTVNIWFLTDDPAPLLQAACVGVAAKLGAATSGGVYPLLTPLLLLPMLGLCSAGLHCLFLTPLNRGACSTAAVYAVDVVLLLLGLQLDPEPLVFLLFDGGLQQQRVQAGTDRCADFLDGELNDLLQHGLQLPLEKRNVHGPVHVVAPPGGSALSFFEKRSLET